MEKNSMIKNLFNCISTGDKYSTSIININYDKKIKKETL